MLIYLTRSLGSINLSFISGLILTVFLILSSCGAWAGDVLRSPPNKPNLSAKYLFYMHGRYVEIHGSDNDYKYTEILKTLAKKGLVVIGEERPDTSFRSYSQKITQQVNDLISAGVPAKNITVAGHSKGGFLSMIISSRVVNTAIKYAILASCGIEGSDFRRPYMRFLNDRAEAMQGKFLVAWDGYDDITRDCDLAMEKAGVTYRNLEFKTGEGHHLFYEPKPVWIEPLTKFALSD